MNRASASAAEAARGQGSYLLETGLALARGWLSPSSTVTVVRPLADGYTNAQVVLCDIGREPATDAIDDPNGQFILKVGFSRGRPQPAAHNAFTEGLADL